MGQLFVLIVDADKPRRALFGRELKKKGIDPEYASTLAEAQNSISQQPYDLVVLRLAGRYPESYQFCRWVRQTHPQLRVVALLPRANTTAESRLFDCGVTDVAASQQTNPRVLSKRIICRLDGCLAEDRVQLDKTLVNFDRRDVLRNGQWTRLTPRLAALLRYFLKNSDRPITQTELRDSEVWNGHIWPHERGGRAVAMGICNLRKAIEIDPKYPRIIQTLNTEGSYRLAPDIRAQVLRCRSSRGIT